MAAAEPAPLVFVQLGQIHTHIGTGIGAGFVARIVLSILMVVKQTMGLTPQLNPVEMITQNMGAQTLRGMDRALLHRHDPVGDTLCLGRSASHRRPLVARSLVRRGA
jgi:hypothetical protein